MQSLTLAIRCACRILDGPGFEPLISKASTEEVVPRPPSGYIVSLVRLHEWGFGVPAGRFVRALCDHYGVELHNFAPNSIS